MITDHDDTTDDEFTEDNDHDDAADEDDNVENKNSWKNFINVVCDEHFEEIPGDHRGDADEDGDHNDCASDEDDAEEVEESNDNPMMKTCLRLSRMMMDSSAVKTN